MYFSLSPQVDVAALRKRSSTDIGGMLCLRSLGIIISYLSYFFSFRFIILKLLILLVLNIYYYY